MTHRNQKLGKSLIAFSSTDPFHSATLRSHEERKVRSLIDLQNFALSQDETVGMELERAAQKPRPEKEAVGESPA